MGSPAQAADHTDCVDRLGWVYTLPCGPGAPQYTSRSTASRRSKRGSGPYQKGRFARAVTGVVLGILHFAVVIVVFRVTTMPLASALASCANVTLPGSRASDTNPCIFTPLLISRNPDGTKKNTNTYRRARGAGTLRGSRALCFWLAELAPLTLFSEVADSPRTPVLDPRPCSRHPPGARQALRPT